MTVSLTAIRNARPTTRDHLWNWVYQFTGVQVARVAVCQGHQAPFDAFTDQCLNRPAITLTLGSRGSGKSFLAAINTHHNSRFLKGHSTRILGGSKDQSRQIYQALDEAIRRGSGGLGSDCDTLLKLLKTEATYRNGSQVSILAASQTSVRGPHVPCLKLDEVDEIDPDIRESAMGMCMARHGYSATVDLTSTWHRVGGPMGELVERARAGEMPFYTFCAFEVLERCPESRSGPNLEKCPECPIMKWCHEERQADPRKPPKAKLSDGHYAIDSLIQKVRTTSRRIFEADYLCRGPKADGVWFPEFAEATHVSERAEYDPALLVHLGIDSGVYTGAVWFQIRELPDRHHRISVFADFLSEGKSAESNARAILDVGRNRCLGVVGTIATDPAGGARNAVGPSVIAEYERVGLRPIRRWPVRPVADSLALLESFVSPATGRPLLTVHPRCKALISAMRTYHRAKRAGQWMDYPEDPQHPAEDLVDALRGGLCEKFPDGRKVQTLREARPASAIIY